MKEILKKNQAITLVSLVVTIIVLIILAGVSINLMLGEKGIITIAKQAKENTELAKIEEETRLNELYMQIEAEDTGLGEISYDAISKLVEFKREIASAITDMGVTTAENADVSTMASNIRSLSKTSSADKVTYDNTNSGLTSTNVQGAVDEINNILNKSEYKTGDSFNTYGQFCAITNMNGIYFTIPLSKPIQKGARISISAKDSQINLITNSGSQVISATNISVYNIDNVIFAIIQGVRSSDFGVVYGNFTITVL